MHPQQQQKHIDQYTISYLSARNSWSKPGDGCFVLQKGDELCFGYVNEEQLYQSDVIHRDGLDVDEDGWGLIGSGRFVESLDYADGKPAGIVAWRRFELPNPIPECRQHAAPSEEELKANKIAKQERRARLFYRRSTVEPQVNNEQGE